MGVYLVEGKTSLISFVWFSGVMCVGFWLHLDT